MGNLCDLCDFNDAYIVVPGKITVTNPGNDDNVYSRKVFLKNSTPFFNCILRINSQLIEDVQDLDIVIPMYNLLYYSKILEKQQNLFRIITQICRNLRMIIMQI